MRTQKRLARESVRLRIVAVKYPGQVCIPNWGSVALSKPRFRNGTGSHHQWGRQHERRGHFVVRNDR